MKKLFTFTFLLSLLAVTVFLSSYKSDTHLFNKCVFPIINTIDKAWAKTDLNGHIKGDSISGYEIWARNHYGTDFKISTVSPYTPVCKELFTDQINYAVGNKVTEGLELLVMKRINSPVLIQFNALDLVASLDPTPGEPPLMFYLMTEDSVVLRADTLSYSAGTGFKFYTMLLSDTVTLQAYTTYYAGIAGPSDCYFIGNEYNATVSSPVPETVNQWIEGTFSLTPPFPAVGDTLSALEGNCNFTYNIRYYLTN